MNLKASVAPQPAFGNALPARRGKGSFCYRVFGERKLTSPRSPTTVWVRPNGIVTASFVSIRVAFEGRDVDDRRSRKEF
jgi:hypothetical protein